MKTIKILLWLLFALQLVYAIIEFRKGNTAFGFNCIWFALIANSLIKAYKTIEEKDKILDSLQHQVKLN